MLEFQLKFISKLRLKVLSGDLFLSLNLLELRLLWWLEFLLVVSYLLRFGVCKKVVQCTNLEAFDRFVSQVSF